MSSVSEAEEVAIEEKAPLAAMMPVNGRMLHDFYGRKIRTLHEDRKLRLKEISTRGQAEAYVAEVRSKIAGCFGNFPERTPLNSQIAGIVSKRDFTIEKIIFESRPGYFVTGLFYLPTVRSGKIPGVLGLCGHSWNGKAEKVYYRFCQALAMKGFAVFMIDPVGQGERLQFLKEKPAFNGDGKSCIQEHSMLGKHLGLCGEFFGAWRAWDGIRALDYLCGRPEIDVKRIGVTGNSGGGTLTAYINALDERPTMVAPGCFITSYLRNFENELPVDSEQVPPGILARGCEMADFIIARAPRPVLILGQKNDFFDPRGTIEAYDDALHIYRLLGAENNIKLFIGPDGHGYHLDNREAMYDFFVKNANLNFSKDEPEEVVPLADSELSCAPDGQVVNMAGNLIIPDYLRNKSEQLASERRLLKESELITSVRRKLSIPPVDKVPEYRILRPVNFSNPDGSEDGGIMNRFLVKTEHDIECALVFISREECFHFPEGDKACLYVSHLSAEAEIRGGILGQAHGEKCFALDIRDIGNPRPVSCWRGGEYFDLDWVDHFYASTGIMLDEPLLSGKVRDTLSAISLLKDRGYQQIHLIGRGFGSMVAAFAGLLSNDVTKVSLVNAPLSYAEMVRNGVSLWPLSCMVPGVLDSFDLPDVYRALTGKQLRVINPWDSMFRTLTGRNLQEKATAAGLDEKLFE
ncbi:MAG: acetylxylan esterase [Victivallales bacterium]